MTSVEGRRALPFIRNRKVTDNLLRTTWTDLDSAELRILLDHRIGRPGQGQRSKLYLPLAGDRCRVVLTFRGKKIVAITPGPAFDAAEWEQVSGEIETTILAGPIKVGREFSFSSFRVQGSWCGESSGVQILPPPEDAPTAPVEIAEHPFILEFPLREVSGLWPVTNHRRMSEHRKLTLLLNVLLAGRTSLQPRRSDHFWAAIPDSDGQHNEIRWLRQFFFAKLGEAMTDKLSPPAAAPLEEVDPEDYYRDVGHDGYGLRVPADLDESLCLYAGLSSGDRRRFDRATFWMDVASRQWTISVSASFASLVSAIESLTGRGDVHNLTCPVCNGPCQHQVPGATERFRAFFDTYAGGAALKRRRNEMYALRSGILHGSDLMQLDQDRAFGGWDPPWWDERELHEELWTLARSALRNWLRSPS